MQFYRFYTVLPKVISFKQCTAFRIRKMSSIDEYILNVAQSEENLLDVGQDIKVWYRTWGNVSKGIPVLFVHGGPGSSTGDYKDMNEKLGLHIIYEDVNSQIFAMHNPLAIQIGLSLIFYLGCFSWQCTLVE